MNIRSCLAAVLFTCSCVQNPSASQEVKGADKASIINPTGTNIGNRFLPPDGYRRSAVDGFGNYLRSLPLQPHGHAVHLYDGTKKGNQAVHAAVVKMDVGSKDLQQCADAVMRLRAEYLYATGEFDKISFNFTNGFPAAFSQWKKGYKIAVNGNNVSWVPSDNADGGYSSFRQYLNRVFMYAGTLSLSRQMKKIPYSELRPGDVLIQGGSPGHAIIVVDMAQNVRGEKVFLLAQSYMPAQEIHVLVNPGNETISPWYSAAGIHTTIHTPEWNFTVGDLKRFIE
ncbi:MAG TPA: DUF4846 domain-containing protein [Flavipsychrobacter sp.]